MDDTNRAALTDAIRMCADLDLALMVAFSAEATRAHPSDAINEVRRLQERLEEITDREAFLIAMLRVLRRQPQDGQLFEGQDAALRMGRALAQSPDADLRKVAKAMDAFGGARGPLLGQDVAGAQDAGRRG